MDEETDTDRYRAPALDKGLDILELLAGVDGGLTQAEIAKRLGRSPNEFYRMLDRLVRRGYVTKIDGDRYALTLKLFGLAQLHAPVRRLVSYATPLMRELAETLAPGESTRRLRPRIGCRDRPAGGAGLLGHLDPRRLPHQPFRHRLRPCAACLPVARRARDDDRRASRQLREAGRSRPSSSSGSIRSAIAATR